MVFRYGGRRAAGFFGPRQGCKLQGCARSGVWAFCLLLWRTKSQLPDPFHRTNLFASLLGLTLITLLLI
jgi:hypothetical protein